MVGQAWSLEATCEVATDQNPAAKDFEHVLEAVEGFHPSELPLLKAVLEKRGTPFIVGDLEGHFPADLSRAGNKTRVQRFMRKLKGHELGEHLEKTSFAGRRAYVLGATLEVEFARGPVNPPTSAAKADSSVRFSHDEEVMLDHVMAKPGRRFTGRELFELLPEDLDSNLRRGRVRDFVKKLGRHALGQNMDVREFGFTRSYLLGKPAKVVVVPLATEARPAMMMSELKPGPVVSLAPDEVPELVADKDTPGWWRKFGLCAQADPDAFFPDKGGSTRAAKRICDGCEVKLECLEYGLSIGDRFGIYGGLSERERRSLKRTTG